MKNSILKKKLMAIAVVFALTISFMPIIGAKAATSTTTVMTSAGNANLKVIDISHYDVTKDSNGNYLYNKFNWTTIKKSVKAIYIKATEGCTITDPCYQTLTSSAQSAGISHGFYHYFWPKGEANARQQADYFYNTIKKYGYDCVPVLDVEEINSQSKAEITKNVTAFADEFKSKSGRDIMIYTSNYFIDEHLDVSLSKYKLWVAKWSTSSPVDTSVWHNWDMWQYSAGAAVSGMPTLVDSNKATSNIFLNSTSGITTVDALKDTYGVGDITVTGWALSYYGVSRVDIYVDGKSFDTLSNEDFTERAAVAEKFGGAGYEDALNSGYSFTIPDGTLSSGSHTVRMAALNSRGNAVWSSQHTFNVKLPDDKTCLDRPSGTYTGDITTSGWAISRFGIKRVDVYVDGKFNGTVLNAAMTERTDVENKFANSGYTDLTHSGFSCPILSASLSGGQHIVRTAAIDNNGKAVWSSKKTFTVIAPDSRICIDRPSGTCTGDITVSGWAISHYGVKRVDIYVDGNPTAIVLNSAMTERVDIDRIFANRGYNDLLHSGFSYTITAGKLSAGTHAVRIALIDKGGKVRWSPQKAFTVS